MNKLVECNYPLHDHPLIYIRDDQQEPSCCSACGLPLSSTPYYKCPQGCNFFLHKACKHLPQVLNHFSSIGIRYSLALVAKPPYNLENWTCDKCGESCKNLITYRSIDENEETIYVDALCAFPSEIKHDLHEHKLVSIHREAELFCDACGRQHKGFFFSCKEYWCDFWIHKDCAELPRVADITFHPHSFSFLYFGYIAELHNCPEFECLICPEKFSTRAAYYCERCLSFAHLHCVSSRIKKDPGYRPVQFPLVETDKSLFIYTMLTKRRIEKNEEDEKLSIEKYHNHPLIIHDNINVDDKDYLSLCNACIQPINSPPFYSCQESRCDFLLHKHCMNLPSKINLKVLSSIEKPATLKLKDEEILSIYKCYFCNQMGNGFRYEFEVLGLSSSRTAHVECASLPRIIRHPLHYKQHILCFTYKALFHLRQFACCPDNDVYPFMYQCASCSFHICIKCALLPTKVSHKFDKHFLQLTSKGCSSTNVNDSEHCFCEICEDYIDTKFWFYHCKDCDHFFHVKCIPSVGVLSKIKFGCTLVIPCHPENHQATFTRMLDIGNQRCGECKQIIRGFRDRAAFQCTKCCYWVHFACALPKVARKLRDRFYECD